MNQHNIIVFGATGSVGRVITEQALAAGHQVTAFTRTPSNMVLQHPTLTVVQGDVLDKEQVNEAVKGHDAVLCVLGAGRHGHVREAGTRNIIAAMQANRVDRLVCQSTLGAGDSRGNLNFFWKHIMFGLLLRPVLVDHNKQENEVINSNLNWTIVRPAAFTDGRLTKRYQSGFSSDAKDMTFKISRADLAHFLLTQVDSDMHCRQAIGLSY